MTSSGSSNRAAIGLLLSLSILWGSTWIANSMLAEPDAPLHMAALRYTLAYVCVAMVYGLQVLVRRARGRISGPQATEIELIEPSPAASTPTLAILRVRGLLGRQTTRRMGANMLLGCTMFAVPDLLQVWAAHHGAGPWTPLIYAGLPLGLLLASGELQAAPILGIGAMLVLLNGSLPLSESKLGWALLIVVAVALQGWSLVYARRHLDTAVSLRGIIVQLGAAAWVLSVADRVWAGPSGHLALLHWLPTSLAALGLLAVLATAVAYPVYYRLLGHFVPAQLAVSAWLQTLVAVGESALLLHRRPGWMMGFAAFVLVGCALVMLQSGIAGAQGDLRVSP